MQKVYNYENCVVTVTGLDVLNQDTLHEATRNFLRKVLEERINDGDSYTSSNFRKEQVLDQQT